MKTDLYENRSYDDNMELLCTAPDELPASPASCLSAALVDIARTAGNALAAECSQHLPTRKRKFVSIVYEIADEAAWRDGGNPLNYAHHGLRSVGVSMSDLMERRDNLRAAMEEIAESHDSPDNDRIAREALDADDQA